MQYRISFLVFIIITLFILNMLTGSAAAQADNRYCGVGNAPNFGGTQDGPAQLPKSCLFTAISGTPSPGQIHQVLAGQSLQTALNNAQCGDTIALQAGATFSGSFTLPAKGCDDQHWITIRTSALASLPAEGTRITPCYAGVSSLPGRPSFHCSSTQRVLPKIIYPYSYLTSSGPIGLAPGANHYRLIGLEITRAAKTTSMTALVIVRSHGTANHIVIDRSWLHGTSQDETATGVSLSGTVYFGIVDSFFTDFHCVSATGVCTDAHAISGGSGSSVGGPYKVVDNFLEGAAEVVLIGGSVATTTPADIEIRRNHMFKPMIWKLGSPGYVGGASGNPFIVKNHFELKNARRVLFEGNVLENNWGGFSQNGFSIVLTPKNQFLGNSNVCPSCQVTDVTIRYSKISNSGAGIQLANILSDGGGIALAGERYSLHDVTVDGTEAKQLNGSGTLIAIFNDWPTNVLNSIRINHITGFPDPGSHMLTLEDNVSKPKMWGFQFTNNVVLAGEFPVWSAAGTGDCAHSDVPITSLAACFSSYTFAKNAIVASPSAFPPSKWPAGNYFPIDAGAVEFATFSDGSGGNYQLLSSSPFKNLGTDGKDLGADINALNKAIAGVE